MKQLWNRLNWCQWNRKVSGTAHQRRKCDVASKCRLERIESLEDRALVTALASLPQYVTTFVGLPGANDPSDVAFTADSRIAVTDTYQDAVFSLSENGGPTYSVSYGSIRDVLGSPSGSVSGGLDGVVSVASDRAGILVALGSPFSSDAVVRLAQDLTAPQLLGEPEVVTRGDYAGFSRVAAGRTIDELFVAGQLSLDQFDGTGVHVLALGDFNGVTLKNGALYAISSTGQLWGDSNVEDGITLAILADVGQAAIDLAAGTFGSAGDSLFALAESGDVVYWTSADLQSPVVPAPRDLFRLPFARGFDVYANRLLFADNEAIGIVIEVSGNLQTTADHLLIPEGSEDIIGVSLPYAPQSSVTVTAALPVNSGFVLSGTSELTFTPDNWSSPQYLTVQAQDDGDTAIGTTTLTLTSGQFGANAVPVSEIENDLHLELRFTPYPIPEGTTATGTFLILLNAAPGGPMTVEFSRMSGDPDLQPVTTSVIFTDQNWRAGVYVEVEALPDVDALDGTAVISATSIGIATLNIPVQENDADDSPQLLLSREVLTVEEGRTSTFQVVLTADPGGPLTVTTSVGSDDSQSEIAVIAHQELHFDSSNWFVPQWVGLKAFTDNNLLDGTSTLVVSAPDIPSHNITIHETDLGAGDQSSTLRVIVDNHLSNPLQGETQPFAYYTTLQGDRGTVNAAEIHYGYAEAKLGPGGGFAGVYYSLQNPLSEDHSLNLQRILPDPIVDPFQYHATAVILDFAEVHGTIKLEIKSSDDVLVWSRTFSDLNETSFELRVEFDGPPPADAQLLTWLVMGPNSSARVEEVSLEVAGPRLSYDMEAALWSYATVLANLDPESGATRDQSRFPVEDFAGVNDAGYQAASAPLAAELGFITEASARNIVLSTGNALLDVLNNSSIGGVLPHFLHLNPQTNHYEIIPGTEYSIIDACIGLGGVLLASEALDLPTFDIENVFQNVIDWEAITLSDGSISHGYSADGLVLGSAWDFFGTESLLVGMFYAAAHEGSTAVIPNVNPSDPRTFNGPAFVDALLWGLADPITTDYTGVDWGAYIADAAARQLEYYNSYSVSAYGASAAESPIPWSVPVLPGQTVSNPYVPYGIGGVIPNLDGSATFNGFAVAPHAAYLYVAQNPEAFQLQFDWLKENRFATPLNHAESLVAEVFGSTTLVTVNPLRGTLNAGLEFAALAGWMLGDDNPLHQASRSNEFVRMGLTAIGDQLQADISGFVFQDINLNGVQDPGEQGLAGVSMYLDENQNGTRDLNEPNAMTNGSGHYQFAALEPREYIVAVEPAQPDWHQTKLAVNFGRPEALPVDTPFVGLADINGDQKPDLIVSDIQQHKLLFSLGLEDGQFAPATELQLSFAQGGVSFGDLDRDGDLDALASSFTPGISYVELRNVNGQFVEQPPVSSIFSMAGAQLADLNADDYLDAVFVEPGGFLDPGRLIVMLNRGDGELQLHQQLMGFVNPTDVLLTDLDGNGIPDLTVIDGSIDRLMTFVNDGDGTFESVDTHHVDIPRTVVAVDLNEDGLPELVVGTNVITIFPVPEPAQFGESIFVYFNQGNGHFAETPDVYNVGQLPAIVAAGDFNHDGRDDVLVGTHGNDDAIRILYNDGEGHLEPGEVVGIGYVTALQVTEIDGDGDLDLVVSTADASRPMLLRNLERQTRLTVVSGAARSDVSFGIQVQAHTPAVSSATTTEDQQTSTGLTITPAGSDGSFETHFKITDIQNGQLFQADGTTPIHAGDFLSANAAAAGLKFTPTTNLNSENTTKFGFNVQASTTPSDAGLGGNVVTAIIIVTPIDTPLTLLLPSTATPVARAGATVQIDPATSVHDSDTVIEFYQATIQAAILSGGNPNDARHGRVTLLIQNQGTGVQIVKVKGSKIFFNGDRAVVARVTGGTLGKPILIRFTAAATEQAVNAVLRQLSIKASRKASTGDRMIGITVTAGGQTAQQTHITTIQ